MNAEDNLRRFPELKRKRVLVIEDDVLQAWDIGEILESFGAQVVGTAFSEKDVWTLIAKPHWDCAVLDLNLHGKFNPDIAKELRERKIPFVVCTAYAPEQYNFLNATILTKPVQEVELATALSKVLSEGDKTLS